jgi:hypothetical protein
MMACAIFSAVVSGVSGVIRCEVNGNERSVVWMGSRNSGEKMKARAVSLDAEVWGVKKPVACAAGSFLVQVAIRLWFG